MYTDKTLLIPALVELASGESLIYWLEMIFSTTWKRSSVNIVASEQLDDASLFHLITLFRIFYWEQKDRLT